jgi:hypothetical protein
MLANGSTQIETLGFASTLAAACSSSSIWLSNS